MKNDQNQNLYIVRHTQITLSIKLQKVTKRFDTLHLFTLQPNGDDIMAQNEITLKVAEAISQKDVGQGVARLDPNVMDDLDIHERDLIEIIGERRTAAIALVLAPTEDNIRVQGDVRGLFAGKVMVQGDIIGSQIRAPRPAMGRGFNSLFDELMDFTPAMREIKFAVVSTNPKDIVIVGPNTEVQLHESPVDVSKIEGVSNLVDVSYEDIGGLKDEVKKVREMIEIPLKRPELFEKLGIAPPKGVLMHGPPGTGKTLLAKAVASESDAHFILINGPEIMSKYVGGSEENLREYFEEAEENSPSIIFIDELDAIAPKREETNGEVERRTVAQLLTLMDGLKSRGQVVVIGATNRPDSLDPALRRPGRFDREIEIGVPDAEERKEVLEIHTRNMPLADDVDLEKIANTTHGFVGADLESLCKEAAMRVVRRILPEIQNDEEIPKEVMEKIVVTENDFKNAQKEIQPSALREVLVQIPDIKWDDVGGLEDVKQELKEAVEWPLKHPETFQRLGIRPPKGTLLYGIPGTGKTLLAKAVASESEANFISVKGPELLSKWVGESEKGVREVFRKAKQASPTVIFFDEIDAIASARSGSDADSGVTKRVVNQLLTEMDGLEELEDVAIIAATNRPDILDAGLMRPGRFDRHIEVGAPDEEARVSIFKVHTKDMPLADDVNLKKLAKNTDGYVGADIEAVCREAAMLALRDNLEASEIPYKYFKDAIDKVKPGNVPSQDEQLVQYM